MIPDRSSPAARIAQQQLLAPGKKRNQPVPFSFADFVGNVRAFTFYFHFFVVFASH